MNSSSIGQSSAANTSFSIPTTSGTTSISSTSETETTGSAQLILDPSMSTTSTTSQETTSLPESITDAIATRGA